MRTRSNPFVPAGRLLITIPLVPKVESKLPFEFSRTNTLRTLEKAWECVTEPREAMSFLSRDNGMVLALFRVAKGAEVKYPAGFHGTLETVRFRWLGFMCGPPVLLVTALIRIRNPVQGSQFFAGVPTESRLCATGWGLLSLR
jgi:hypothetical protein